MKFDFSIESSIDKIQNRNTREYFLEVYQTFVNGNYRSSTVMLYSVLICDLVYKLRDLRDIYGEVKAGKILAEIEDLQLKNPNSPEWESKLIEAIKTRTSLLESSDIVAIESLQKFRHLSAHPVLNNSDLLYSPNRDTVQALIRNIVEGILTNPPFFSNRIFDTMLSDLSEVKGAITETESLERYVTSRYLNKLKDNDFRKVYRSLWKIVFINENAEAIENRSINYRVLMIFTSHRKSTCLELIKSESHYYSNINKEENVFSLIHLISSNPDVYSLLEDPLKLLIATAITNDSDMRLMSWFLKSSVTEHIESLSPDNFYKISDVAFEHMLSLAKDNGCETELINFSIEYFGDSESFDVSRHRYNYVLVQVIDELSLTQTERLLEVSNNNNQILSAYGLKGSIREIAEKYEGEIDKSKFKRLYN